MYIYIYKHIYIYIYGQNSEQEAVAGPPAWSGGWAITVGPGVNPNSLINLPYSCGQNRVLHSATLLSPTLTSDCKHLGISPAFCSV